MTAVLAPEQVEAPAPLRGRRRAPEPPRQLRPPRPPKRVLKALKTAPPMSPRRTAVRMAVGLVAALLLGMVLFLTVYGQLAHVIAQDRLNRQFREELLAGTAPVSEGTFEGVLLRDGDPVAQLQIPEIGVDETIVEGTTSGVLAAGPGHRRDTVLPGQAGVSVIMGRAAAFGGPFARLQELQPGEEFTVVTGQGEHTYQVIGVRYVGDPSPAPITAGQGRLILVTARGPAFVPTGVLRVDAELTSTVKPPGARATTHASLPEAATELAGDTSHLWALVFVLQAIVAVEIAAVWTYRRIGARQAWTVVVPVGLLVALAAADQLTRLLPNLL